MNCPYCGDEVRKMKCENCGQDVKYPSEHWQDAIMPDDFEGWLCEKLQ